MEGLREIGVIWTAELSRAVRSARVIVLLVLYALFTLMALAVVGGIARSIETGVRAQAASSDAEQVTEGLAQARKQFVAQFFSDDEALTDALAQIPIVLLVVFKTSLRFLPLLIALMGFDQLAGELGPRSIRYLVVRSRRSSVLLGKLLAQASLLAALMLVIDLGLCVHAASSGADFGAGAAALTFFKLWGTSLVFALPYLALTNLLSASARQPVLSLIGTLIALVGIWFLSFVGGFFSFSAAPPGAPSALPAGPTSPLAYLRYLSVWHYSADLLHPGALKLATAAFAHLGFAAAFVALALLILRRRDL